MQPPPPGPPDLPGEALAEPLAHIGHGRPLQRQGLLVLVLLGSGTTGHLGQRKGMAQYASSAGVPAAEPLVVLSGVMIIVGGLMVALGVWGDLGALLLLVFVLATALLRGIVKSCGSPVLP